MKRLLIQFVPLACLGFACGCFTSCSSSSTAPAANLSAITGGPGAKGASGTMTFYREKGFIGGGLNTSVYVDGVEIADLDPGEFVVVKASAGAHKIHSDEDSDQLTAKVEAGKNQFYRIKIVAGMWKGHGILQQVDTETGTKECVGEKLTPCKDVRQPAVVMRSVPTR